MITNRFNTIVIGGGQAGLSAGYYLKEINDNFIILDESKRIGDVWRNRWDSLKLFTPSQYDSLPGFPFPAKKGYFPTKDGMADYLESYSEKFSLPVETGTKVIELKKNSSGYIVMTDKGNLLANNVIAATGTNPVPKIPEFANELDPNIMQIHSSEYKNPQSLVPDTTMVVGAATSGIEIAYELSQSRKTMLSGKPTARIPVGLRRYAGSLYWFFINNILTVGTPIGRRIKPKIIKGGGPLLSTTYDDVMKAGVETLPRLLGAEDGMPKLRDGRVKNVKTIIWATGYKPDFSWIKMNITNESGWPVHNRGISRAARGIFFVGLLFQYGLTSGLVGGVGRDAAFVVQHIKNLKH